MAFLGIVVAFLELGGRSVVELLTGDLLALLGGVTWGSSNVLFCELSRVGGAATAKTVHQVATAALVLGAFATATAQTESSCQR